VAQYHDFVPQHADMEDCFRHEQGCHKAVHDADAFDPAHRLDHGLGPVVTGVLLRQAGQRQHAKRNQQQNMFKTLRGGETSVFFLACLMFSHGSPFLMLAAPPDTPDHVQGD
jgi:hypothetical protein